MNLLQLLFTSIASLNKLIYLSISTWVEYNTSLFIRKCINLSTFKSSLRHVYFCIYCILYRHAYYTFIEYLCIIYLTLLDIEIKINVLLSLIFYAKLITTHSREIFKNIISRFSTGFLCSWTLTSGDMCSMSVYKL